ncbi:hypothetical protein [Rhodococcus sp. NPDC127528]|uniref:hypothetical protein n=1 Tax=unclassified Rhodococcus (in: high G+C Gram-positive bacteria) TaxID=192944 RepID=UPI003642F119
MAATDGTSRPVRSHRRVLAAVDAVLDMAAQTHAVTIEDIAQALAASRRRPIEIEIADLGPGVWGQRREFPDHDEIVLARSLPSIDRTLAHEIGHIVFRHPGAAISETTLAADDDLIAYMLSQRAAVSADLTAESLHEWEAEAFAVRLLQRLGHFERDQNWRPLLCYDEALG